MPEENERSGEVNEALEIFGVILIAHNKSSKVKKPGEHSLYFPAAHVPSQGSPILSWNFTAMAVWRNHFRSVCLHELLVQPIAVVRFVADQSLRHICNDALCHRRGDQFHFSRRSVFCPQGDRKTMAVCNAHDLGPLATLGLSDLEPPFLAGTKVPSTKHSLRSSPPAFLRCAASASRIFCITPERTQFWKRRCAVWYGPYREGRSFQGAPVRRIQSTPLRTLRRSLQGRPRLSSRTGSSGRMVETILHCSSVKSIHEYYTVPPPRTRDILALFHL